MGVPDHRLVGVPGRLRPADGRARRRAAVPGGPGHVEELCAELASYGVPDSIQHDDLHDVQVFVRDGRQLVMDWGDACVSQPFCVLSVALEGVIAWGLDDVEDSVDTDAVPRRLPGALGRSDCPASTWPSAVTPAVRLGWAIRAVNGHVAGDVGQTLTRLRMFLDGRA